MFVSSASYAADACLIDQLMVTGASVSAGFDGKSYAVQLAERYLKQDLLLDEAHSGERASVILARPAFAEKAKKASMVLALDLFYWDHLNSNEPEWETTTATAIDALFANTVKAGIPLVVGNILKPQDPFDKIVYRPKAAQFINTRLKTLCDAAPDRCFLIDNADMGDYVNTIFEPLVEQQEETVREEYIKEHITRDGIHPRTDAYAVMTAYLDLKIRASNLHCR